MRCEGGTLVNLLVLDFESFYSVDYTLKKLTTEAYVRDERFEALCVAMLNVDTMKSMWLSADEVEPGLKYGMAFARLDWRNTAVVCHHAHFDGLILSHHYGVRPAYWFDTLSMGRLIVGNHLSVSLASLAAHFGLAPKSIDYQSFIGKHWADLSEAEQQALGDGCAHDVELTYQLFQKLLPLVPRAELDLIDLTVRMFTEPCIEGDVEELERIAAAERLRKQTAMDELGITSKELASAEKFAAILTGLGIEVEYKTTPQGNSIPALAATDDFMKELLEDENELIAALASARVGSRSSIDETRASRLAGAARRGSLPIYLGYCAAHTTRWGGGDKVNFQNFRRGGEIRKALRAPAGHLLLVVDASQIECRLLEYVAGEEQALEDFRKGGDPYVSIASEFYGREITKADKAERGMGKQIRLSCGYGAGGDSIVRTAKRGTYGPPVVLRPDEGLAARDLYRRSRPGVVNLWKEGDWFLTRIGGDEVEESYQWGPVQVHPNGDGSGWIALPGGPKMLYTLEWDAGQGGWKRKTRKGWSRIWGGHLVENLIQYLARCYAGEIMVDVKNTFPDLRLAWMSHDELVYVVPDDPLARVSLDVLLTRFRVPPAWAPGLPLDAEGSLSKVYEK
jgi:DNA polymerase